MLLPPREESLVNSAYRKRQDEDLKAEADNMARIVVLGLGNVLLKDEGVGIHVVHALQDSQPPPDVDLEVIDGGTSPEALYLAEGADKVIVIDAVKGGSGPGSVYRFRPTEISLDDKDYLSLHQIGILESLRIMEYMGKEPKDTVVLGVEPKEITWGLELSPELEHKVPQIVKLVMEEARRC
jgi:hydrogenase maturation protease